MTDPDDRLRALYSARRQRDQENLLRVFGDPGAEQMLGAAVAEYETSPEYEQDQVAEAEQLLAEAITSDDEGEPGVIQDSDAG